MLEDFRRLELVRDGRKETIRSRWRQDKGHRAEWAAFVSSITRREQPAIRFEEIVCSTLATIRIDESLATGEAVTVSSSAFLDAANHSPNQDPSRNE